MAIRTPICRARLQHNIAKSDYLYVAYFISSADLSVPMFALTLGSAVVGCLRALSLLPAGQAPCLHVVLARHIHLAHADIPRVFEDQAYFVLQDR